MCPKAGLCPCKLVLPSLPFKGAAFWESSWTMTRPLHGLPSDSPQTQSLLQFVASFPSPISSVPGSRKFSKVEICPKI